VAAGAGAALPHYHSGAVRIERDKPLLVDWGAKLNGYTSDMTRTLALGKSTPRWDEVYQVVLDAHLAAIEHIRPGARLCDVDAAARNVIRVAGYGDFFGHGLGHGIGLNVHEMPRMAAIEHGELRPGMVITVEPGIYLPGELGVRIEDDVLVTENGHEVLCSLPKGLEENRIIL
jgi:Xaa-Pro aminopeptidase